jgi:hypothetical protein
MPSLLRMPIPCSPLTMPPDVIAASRNSPNAACAASRLQPQVLPFLDSGHARAVEQLEHRRQKAAPGDQRHGLAGRNHRQQGDGGVARDWHAGRDDRSAFAVTSY